MKTSSFLQPLHAFLIERMTASVRPAVHKQHMHIQSLQVFLFTSLRLTLPLLVLLCCNVGQ